MHALPGQAFRLQCGYDRRTRGGAFLERVKVPELREIHLDLRRPGSHGKEIRICNGKSLSEEILTPLELLIDQGIALEQILLALGLNLRRGVGPEEGAVG